jgi:hypothetical protein
MSIARLSDYRSAPLDPSALDPGRYLTDSRRLFRVVARFTMPPDTVLVALEDCVTLSVTALLPSEIAALGLSAVASGQFAV